MATGGSLIALSGSLPKGAPVSYYSTLVREIAAAGGRALVDTSGPALAAGLQARPFAVKPNRVEAENLLGRSVGGTPRELAAAATEIQAQFGVPWVLLSNGSCGLVVLDGTGAAWHGTVELTQAEQSEIVNDQGCGDALVASFLGAFAEREPHGAAPPTAEAICRAMCVCGTANLFTPMPGQLCGEILKRFEDGGMESKRVKVVPVTR